ncbi:MAG: septation protein SpoVG family protein [Lachnospiraceae bacterium]|nr:septation protein SpoVG family protein [Lachnospiraceae bacterium]
MKVTVNITRNAERTEKQPYGFVSIYLNDEFYLNSFQIRKNLSNGNYFVSAPNKFYVDKEGVEKAKMIIEIKAAFKGIADKIIENFKELEQKNEKVAKISMGEEKPINYKVQTYLKEPVAIKNDGKIIGKAKLSIDDIFTINDITVIRDKEQKAQILYPSYNKTNVEGEKEYKEFCNPITADCRSKVLEEVEKSIVKAEEWQKQHSNQAQTKTQEQTQAPKAQTNDAPVM